MATLTVFEFNSPDGAQRTVSELGSLQEQRPITIQQEYNRRELFEVE